MLCCILFTINSHEAAFFADVFPNPRLDRMTGLREDFTVVGYKDRLRRAFGNTTIDVSVIL